MNPSIHLFDGKTCQPRCGASSHSWHWTVDPAAVTCPDCARLADRSPADSPAVPSDDRSPRADAGGQRSGRRRP